MPIQLCLIIILISLFFLLYVFYNIKKGTLSTKHALIWVIVAIALIIFTLTNEFLLKIASFFGIEKVSNMLFFFGFIFLIYIIFNMTKNISKLNKEMIRLTQEIGLLKKDKNDE